MYGYSAAPYPADAQQAQVPWPGEAGGWVDTGMEGAAMMGPAYGAYGAQAHPAAAYAQPSPAAYNPAAPNMPQQQQQQGMQQYSGGCAGGCDGDMGYGGTRAPQPMGSDMGGGMYGGKNGNSGKGSYGGGGYKGGKSGGYTGGGGCGYGGGSFEYEDYEYYPRYSQGHGPEYAQNQLTSCMLDDDEGLSVTVYGEQGETIPKACSTWDEAAMIFPPMLVQTCRDSGFEKPMPIQAHTWGVGCAGRDIIGVAKTGSGKTLAYLFLGFLRILSGRPPSPAMLVLAPTRELAQQIETESQKFGMPMRIRTACCYGGAPRGPQLGQLRRNCQVIVACPGRLNDFLQQGQVRLGTCAFLVLDEADRMLDLGFEPQIRQIITTMPAQRQTLLYTATWPKELRSLASDFLTKPIHVHVGKSENHLSANQDITQIVKIVQNDQEKMAELRKVFDTCQQGDRVLIFCETKMATAYLAEQLTNVERIYTVAIHGDMAQRDRDWSLEAFRSGRAPIMVATDVAGRGLDIKGIRAVVNWDAAHNAEDYVHRIGRTARAGAKGMAFTFLAPSEARKAKDVVQVMQNTGLEVPPELLQLSGVMRNNFRGKGKKGGKGKGGKGGKGKGKGKGKGGGGGKGGGFGNDMGGFGNMPM